MTAPSKVTNEDEGTTKEGTSRLAAAIAIAAGAGALFKRTKTLAKDLMKSALHCDMTEGVRHLLCPVSVTDKAFTG